MRFYQDAELLFREVKRTEDGSWLACCSSPTSAPFFVCKQNMEQFDSVEAPEEIVRAFAPDVKRTPAELKRLVLIQPLLEDESCITDRCKRKALAESINCAGCDYLDRECVPCAQCIRAKGYADYYRPQEASK